MQYRGIDWGTRKAAWCAVDERGELLEGMVAAGFKENPATNGTPDNSHAFKEILETAQPDARDWAIAAARSTGVAAVEDPVVRRHEVGQPRSKRLRSSRGGEALCGESAGSCRRLRL